MSINIYCDTCDWFGDIKEFDSHLDNSPECDYRDTCCKSQSIKDYDSLDPDDICIECKDKLRDYWEDFWTDLAIGER